MEHFRFPMTTEELAQAESARIARFAEEKWTELDRSFAAGPFRPDWESLDAHTCPEWFIDAKFGMCVDWGLYSVAGWGRPVFEGVANGPMYPDWYLWDMYERDEARAYHAKTWGAHFERDDFIPHFTAAAFDAGEIAALARRAGMRYVVPFCKHHDGFCLWSSACTRRSSGAIGPRRDLVGELAQAARREDLKFGAYFSVDEWEYPMLGPNGAIRGERVWATTGSPPPHEVPYDASRLCGRIGGKIPVADFIRHYIVPQCMELIEHCDPDLLWLDGEWKMPAERRGTRELAAYLYNRAAGRKDVAMNDRYGEGTRAKHGDFYTSEYNVASAQRCRRPWEEVRSIGRYYGYYGLASESDVLSDSQLIHMLVDIVSRGGNMLLVVNPTGEGAIPATERSRLDAVGRWLAVNGEAIYGARPVDIPADRRPPNMRFTRSKDGRYTYAVLLDGARREAVLPADLALATGARLLCAGGSAALATGLELPSRREGDNVVVTLPESRPGEHAWTLRLECRG
jgi:alpha-L-fucosidase